MSRRRLIAAVAAAIILLPGLTLPACHTSKTSTTAERSAAADTARAALALTQVQAAATAAVTAGDSSASHEKKAGQLDIERDSAGRPVRLSWWSWSLASARSAHASVTDISGDIAFADVKLSRYHSGESAQESESEKHTRPALSGVAVAGYVFFLVTMIVISLRIWTATRKR